MNYETAKALKDAGFPQPKLGPTTNTNGRDAYVPTLEELIEACGNRQFRLQKVAGAWVADIRDMTDEEYAPTPTEAVAKLWLALNTKV